MSEQTEVQRLEAELSMATVLHGRLTHEAIKAQARCIELEAEVQALRGAVPAVPEWWKRAAEYIVENGSYRPQYSDHELCLSCDVHIGQEHKTDCLVKWAEAMIAAAPQPERHDELRCAVGNCTFNGEVATHTPGCPSAPQPAAQPTYGSPELEQLILDRLARQAQPAAQPEMPQDWFPGMDQTYREKAWALTKAQQEPARPAVPQFAGVAARKLADLQAQGWQINGYHIQRQDGDTWRHGAVTSGGMVLWWHGKLDAVTVQRQPMAPTVPADADINQRILFKACWKAAEAAHGITQ